MLQQWRTHAASALLDPSSTPSTSATTQDELLRVLTALLRSSGGEPTGEPTGPAPPASFTLPLGLESALEWGLGDDAQVAPLPPSTASE
jgi:hypothetical protein